MNEEIKETLKRYPTHMKFQQMQPNNKIIPHTITGKPRETVGIHIVTVNNSHLLCIKDYHSQFLVINRVEWLSAEQLMMYSKIGFAEYELLCGIISEAQTNFISDKFKTFCWKLNKEHGVSSPKWWPGRSMHQICKEHHDKMHLTL